ncbi:hypothetical protein EPUL_003744, partial [Erysiphe pulchra]
PLNAQSPNPPIPTNKRCWCQITTQAITNLTAVIMNSTEITIGNPAPPADESIQPPIPRTPSIPSTSPNPPHSSIHQIPQFQTTAEIPAQNRPILEPVPPSKSAAQHSAESSQVSQDSITDNHHSFLPQELAQIFKSRQKQEQLWHTRLMVCTSFYSCIESVATSFKDGEEKDLAIMLQENLKSTIAKFAASDADPKAYRLQLKSSTTKQIESVKPKETSQSVPVAVPLIFSTTKSGCKVQNSVNPTLPPKPIVNMNSWSTVVRNGFKKTKAAKSPASQKITQTQPKSSGHQPNYRLVNNKMPNPTQKTTKPQDKRLFIRLPNEHDWLRSGFALSPSTNEAREALLNAAIRLTPFRAKLKSATNWTSVLIPTVPKSLDTLNGDVEVTKELLSQEIERVTRMRPSFLKLYSRNVLDAPHRTWMAFFTKAPRPGFRVFDESGVMRTFKRQQSPGFCKRCNSHHPPKNCSRAPSCGNCGSTMHSEDLCMAQTRCKNCGGPHRSDKREYQAILRANSVEKMASTTETEGDTTISSQPLEITDASPIEATIVDAMRL